MLHYSFDMDNTETIKGVIFDFDGVIADSESLHLRAFQETVKTLGLVLSTRDYYSRYLAFDDRTFFKEFLFDNASPVEEVAVAGLVERKAEIFREMAADGVRIFPGVREFLETIDGRFHTAIGSGATREEIGFVLGRKGLSRFFGFVVGADDTETSKPSPEVYLKCLERLRIESDETLTSEQCVVFEDSPHGVLAASGAGMKCVGITNSCEAEELSEADRVIGSFFEIMDDFPANL